MANSRAVNNKGNSTKKRQNVKLNSKEKARRQTTARRDKAYKQEVLEGQLRIEIWGIVLFTIAAIFTIALVISGRGESTGLVGGAIAGFLFKLFGSAAYVVPVILAYTGILMFFRKSGYLISVRLIGLFILVVCASLSADLIIWGPAASLAEYKVYLMQTAEAGGGLLGSSVSWLFAKMLGHAGAIVLDIALGITGAVLITNVPIATFVKFVFGIVKWILSFIAGIFIWLFEALTKKRNTADTRPKREKRKPATAKNVRITPSSPPVQNSVPSGMFDMDSVPSIYRRDADKDDVGRKAARAEAFDDVVPDTLNDGVLQKDDKAQDTAKSHEYMESDTLSNREEVVSDEPPKFETAQVEKVYERRPKKQTSWAEKEDVREVQCKLNLEEEKARRCNLPPLSLLKSPSKRQSQTDMSSVSELSKMLEDTLASFGVSAEVTDVSRGPMVTRFEVHPGVGVKVSKIVGLADDLALAFAAPGVRIEAPIPGKAAVGIEVPNKAKNFVLFREVLESPEFMNSKSKLTIALGKDIAGKTIVADMADILHLLVAGSTGSGKSVCLNSIIGSLLFKATPDEVRLLMIDPKRVELSIYDGIPHLLAPVVTDSKKAAGYLKWVVEEMENRYKLFQMAGTRNISQYNDMIAKGKVQQFIPDDEEIEPLDGTSDEEGEDQIGEEAVQKQKAQNLKPLPYIVVILDELADLMMVAAGEIEDAICRLAFMARAAGIHLILATQRPSVDVVTGIIKANIPSRIAFAVSSQVDSRIILDSSGAERLLGKGDMLFHPIGLPKPIRVQGAFVSDEEVASLVAFLKDQGSPTYQAKSIEKSSSGKSEGIAEDDELFADAARLVVESGEASISKVQRRFRVGYARAARLIDTMEVLGIIGSYEGSKARKVLVGPDKLEEILSGENESDIA